MEAEAIPMGIYEPQPRRTEEIRARVPKATKRAVEFLARVWTAVERVRTQDEDVELSEADVINRLMTVALESAWAEIGHEPRTDAEVEEVIRRAIKALTDTIPEPRKK